MKLETENRHSEAVTSSEKVLAEALRAACVELMQNYGIVTSEEQPGPRSEPPVSLFVAGVDFKGRQLRGTVALWAAEEVLLETTRGAPGLGTDPDDLPDWACELANQLAGRVKNKLRAYGVLLTVNVPRLLSGPDVSELDQGVQHRFSCDFGTVAAYLDVLLSAGFVLNETVRVEPLAQEGEFTLF